MLFNLVWIWNGTKCCLIRVWRMYFKLFMWSTIESRHWPSLHNLRSTDIVTLINNNNHVAGKWWIHNKMANSWAEPFQSYIGKSAKKNISRNFFQKSRKNAGLKTKMISTQSHLNFWMNTISIIVIYIAKIMKTTQPKMKKAAINRFRWCQFW